MSYSPFIRSENFGASGNLGENLNDDFEYDNLLGFPSVAFRLTIPTGAEVAFEATFDGTNWIPISLRSVNTDEFAQSADADDNFIGSISNARKFRVRTSSAGSAAGSVIGRATDAVSMLEGQEFFPPPDKIGQSPVHKDANFTSAQTGASLWVPASGKKFVITDYFISATGTVDGVVRIFDQTDSSGNYLFRATMDPSAQNSIYIPHSLRVPFVSSAADNILKITTTANVKFSIVLHGYEKS